MDAEWRIQQFIPTLPAPDVAMLRLFHMELLNSNEKTNLISTYTEKNADLIHFFDCIKAAEFMGKDTKFDTYYDLGSGSGFPGIVFALLNKDRKVVLVEMEDRKADFLKHVVAKLDIKNAQVINGKAEDLKIKIPQGAMCRSFTNLARTLLLSNKILPKDSVIYSLKGSDWFAELASLPSQICSTWNTEMAFEYDLPENLGTRVLIRSIRIA